MTERKVAVVTEEVRAGLRRAVSYAQPVAVPGTLTFRRLPDKGGTDGWTGKIRYAKNPAIAGFLGRTLIPPGPPLISIT